MSRNNKPRKNKRKAQRRTTHRGRDHVDQRGAQARRDVIGVVNNYVTVHEGAARSQAGLPGPQAGFTGRETDLERLLESLDPAMPGGAAVVVSTGMGGIGKTQLALTAGHRALEREWFSGALFIDMHGYTTPVTAHRALQSLLRELGVETDRIPEEADARAALYRATVQAASTEEGGPLLVVADNVSTPGQVLPLDPGPGGHRLLVTSRERMGELPARHLSLGVLSQEESVRLLTADLHVSDPDDDRVRGLEALTRVADSCGGVPLALRIAAGQLKNAPDMDVGELADTLAHTADRLAPFSDQLGGLEAVFAASFARLPAEQAEMLTLLGLAPGPDISTSAAAVLAGVEPGQALPRLRGLTASHFVAVSDKRWAMHDLVAAYAATLSGPRPAARFPRAQRRLLDHYTDQVIAATEHLRALPTDRVPEAFTGRAEALAWLDAERTVLIDTVHLAHRVGHDRATVSLPINLGTYLDQRRLFHDQIAITRLALQAAQRIGDHRGEAMAWNNLGSTLFGMRRFEESVDAHTRARDLFQRFGDHRGEAMAWNNLGSTLFGMRRFEESVDAHTRARDLFQRFGDHRGEATAWNNLGGVLSVMRRFEEAAAARTRARDLFRRFGDHHNAEKAYAGVGIALGGLRRWDEAAAILERVVTFFSEQGDQHSEGMGRYELGLVRCRSGHPDLAIPLLEKAVELLRATDDPHRHDRARDALNEARAAD
ncbi:MULTISPECIES: tetratricopeptide repeat protein [Nocardiopsis]|uniref:Uncharacterized protein n=1 Tax=Nocardiopsis sinuspersici TaxID=501010 RepID=A0A1V3C0J4_9ACTN|nr:MULTISPECIES: tetratricopeptide repeat protein [Nocardiopsis]OOC54208.1 hypothetical protein NOSIN_10645 [Nocardiopsis sinuspersici]